jgi:hypothetical protein
LLLLCGLLCAARVNQQPHDDEFRGADAKGTRRHCVQSSGVRRRGVIGVSTGNL